MTIVKKKYRGWQYAALIKIMNSMIYLIYIESSYP